MITMPGKSHRGALPPLTAEEKQLSARLLGHVAMLAGGIGERNMFNYAELQKSAEYISDRLREMGYKVKTETYLVEGRASANLVVEIQGKRRPEEIVLLGGHLDSWHSATGATDNGIGCAIMMEAVRILQTIGVRPTEIAAATLRFTAVSVSPNRRRRSEWPMITYAAPASLIMPAEISPVNAPSRSQ